MKSYDQEEISFFNGQALLAGSEGDYLDPNEAYFSSIISSNTIVGVQYECSKKETIKQPAYYPTGRKNNYFPLNKKRSSLSMAQGQMAQNSS
jgi:hypothetical protein